MAKKRVYLFREIEEAEAYAGDRDGVKSLLGGKGANLAEMARLGVPVPPGFTVTTEACIEYLEHEEGFPDDLWEEERDALRRLEEAAGKRFGDASSPLLLSCRSGARFSMPGMMDTILNLGMTDEVAEGMVRLTGDPRFVYDSYRRLVQMFGAVVRGMRDEVFEEVIEERRQRSGVDTDAGLSGEDWHEVTERFKELVRRYTGSDFPQDPWEQLRMATEAVFKSWNGKRAASYREAAGIAHDLGTALNIQAMVFGNMGDDSATGVVMSRNPSTGEAKLEGDFLLNAQGEDVGIRETFPIAEMERVMPEAYQELEAIARRLENHYRNMRTWSSPRSTALWVPRHGTKCLTRCGRTSHAALVARQFGRPAVVGVGALEIDLEAREAWVGEVVVREGDLISIDGLRGEVYVGELPTVVPDIRDEWLTRLLGWADEFRDLATREPW